MKLLKRNVLVFLVLASLQLLLHVKEILLQTADEGQALFLIGVVVAIVVGDTFGTAFATGFLRRQDFAPKATVRA